MKVKDEKRTLKIAEIRALIKDCGTCGVTDLKFGDLEVKFGRPVEHAIQTVQPVWAPESLNLSDTEISEQAQKTETEALEVDELYSKESRLAQMMIEDPAAYEEMVLSGELENNG